MAISARSFAKITFGFFILCMAVSAWALPQSSVPNSPAGFNQQYDDTFSNWMKNNKSALETDLQGFAIPAAWFVETFGDQQGPELAKFYSSQFDDFKSETRKRFEESVEQGRKYPGNTDGMVTQLLIDATLPNWAINPSPKPPPQSIQPLPLIQSFSIQTHLRLGHGDQNLVGWMDSYIYLDGEFRFIGAGAYPFWDPMDISDPCAKNGENPGGKLIKEVKPEYPREAKEQHIKGSVRAILRIAMDGSVETATITGGPAPLQDAARTAFMQWQYSPFIYCGKAIEMRVRAHIKIP